MKNFNKYYLIYALIAVLYCSLIIIIPPDASVLTRYSLSPSSAKLLSLSLALPILVIWWLGFFGFVKLKEYAHDIKTNKDGKSLEQIGNGLMIMAIGGPLISMINSYSNHLATQRPSLTSGAVITYNYLTLIMIFATFYLVHEGASKLSGILKKKELSRTEILIKLIFAAFSILYIYFTLQNPSRQFPGPGISRAAYYLSDSILVITIIIPYLFVWWYGIRATYLIQQYSKKVSGIIYRQSLSRLAAGLGLVVVTYMLLRFLTSFTTQLNSWSLKVLLLVVYLLLIFLGLGFGLIAKGAKQLKKLEEV